MTNPAKQRRRGQDKLTGELVVVALIDVHTDGDVGDDVLVEHVVLRAAVGIGTVVYSRQVTSLVGVDTV